MNEEEKKELIKEVRSAVRSILIDITRADHEEIKRLRGRMVELEQKGHEAKLEHYEAETRKNTWLVDKHGPRFEAHLESLEAHQRRFDAALEKSNEVNARLAEAVMAIAQAVKHHGEKQ